MNYDGDDVPIFKTEHSLFRYMVEGRKFWDCRIRDMSDDRIYTLSFFDTVGPRPQCPYVGFVDKETGQLLIHDYRAMEFSDYAINWCFLVLGLQQYVSEPPPGEKEWYPVPFMNTRMT